MAAPQEGNALPWANEPKPQEEAKAKPEAKEEEAKPKRGVDLPQAGLAVGVRVEVRPAPWRGAAPNWAFIAREAQRTHPLEAFWSALVPPCAGPVDPQGGERGGSGGRGDIRGQGEQGGPVSGLEKFSKSGVLHGHLHVRRSFP